MSTTDHLIEQEMKRHEAHLKRLDELFERAREASETSEERDPLIDALATERDELARALHTLRHEPPENLDEVMEQHFGPLIIWEMIARLIERSIERLEKKSAT